MAETKVLLADDEGAIRNLYQELLESEGFVVDIAEDGRQALAKLREQPYSLIILDIMMPKLDGIGVLKQLSTDTQNTQTPVIITSNLNDPEASTEAKELGARKVLLKSDLDPDEFLREVTSVVSSGQ